MVTCFQTTKKHILAYRLFAHHLDRRRPSGKIVEAAAVIGFRNQLPLSVMDAFAARIDGITLQRTEQSFLRDKALVQTLGIRGFITVYPRSDAPVFTRALLPQNDIERDFLLKGAHHILARLDIAANDILSIVESAVDQLLRNRSLPKSAFYEKLSQTVESYLEPAKREIWRWPNEHVAGETLGESLMRITLPIIALKGMVCLIPEVGHGKGRQMCLTRTMYGTKYPKPSEASDRAASDELVRRYLKCFGPATEEGFARWAGIHPNQAERMWEPLLESLVEVVWEDKSAWMHEQDVEALKQHHIIEGLRLIGPNDPWLQQEDRAGLVQGKRLFNYFYRSKENPGMMLFDGQCVAGWRLRRQGNKLYVTVEDIGLSLGRIAVPELEEETSRLAIAYGLRPGGFSLVSL